MHTASLLGSNFSDVESVFSAEPTISVYPFNRYKEVGYDANVYSVKAPEEVLKKAQLEVYKDYAGKTYGFLQLLWYIYGSISEKIGFDVRKQGNWFPDNAVCSEIEYNRLKIVAQTCYPELLKELEEWDSNAFTPKDMAQIRAKYPSIFQLEAKYVDGTCLYRRMW